MTQFIMPVPDAARPIWNTLDAFTQGYIEAMFFAECEPGTTSETHDPERHSALPGDVGFDDLAPDAFAAIIADCQAFRDSLPRDHHDRTPIDLACDYASVDYDERDAGRDFWFTRNGHGVGFWDRGLGDVGDTLTHACGWRTPFPEVNAYLGDDGRIYVM